MFIKQINSGLLLKAQIIIFWTHYKMIQKSIMLKDRRKEKRIISARWMDLITEVMGAFLEDLNNLQGTDHPEVNVPIWPLGVIPI